MIKSQICGLTQSQAADEAAVIAYIISTNMRRRHLTESQRASIAASLANLEQGRPETEQTGKFAGLSQSQAAGQMQVSERLVRDAKMVQKEAPDLAAKVKSDEMKVSRINRT